MTLPISSTALWAPPRLDGGATADDACGGRPVRRPPPGPAQPTPTAAALCEAPGDGPRQLAAASGPACLVIQV